jgi:hypothetical protein
MIQTKTFCSTLTTFSASFKLAGVEIGNRMTVIKCDNDKLWVHSPILLDTKTKQALSGMGDVTWAISPNLFHYLHVHSFHSHFPNCALFGVNGIEKKEKKCSFNLLNNNSADELWHPPIKQLQIQGMPNANEVVFLHPESKTLIVTDLLFNCYPTKLWSKLFLKLNGAYNKCCSTRIFKSFISDKNKFKDSIDQLLTWDFDRIILTHGNIIEKNGKEIFEKSFSWLY